MYKGNFGVQIGEKHTLNDWKLGWTEITLGFPEARIYEQDVPGMDGTLDFTESVTGGDVKYKSRTLTLKFETPDRDYEEWETLTSEIASYIAGRRRKIILDTDPGFYYIGRLTMEAEKTDREGGTLTITGDVDPYKYEMYSSLEDWLWDAFCFERDIARNYKDIAVDGRRALVIPGRRKWVVPTITASDDMEAVFKGVTYQIPKGTSKVFGICIEEGDNTILFKGSGTISIDYRGGML